MKHILHKSIGAILFKGKKSSGRGTGILISPNLVLTVAHSLCNSAIGEEYTDFKFYPRQNGTLTKYYSISKVFYPKEYLSQQNNLTKDYGLMLLSEKVPQ